MFSPNLEAYAEKMGQSVDKAVFSLLGEVEGVLRLILSDDLTRASAV